MFRKTAPVLAVLAAFFSGCGPGQVNLGAPPPLHLIKYEYPFGYFQANYSDDPQIEDVYFKWPASAWPVIWIGDEALDLGKETRQTLEQKFGEKLKKQQEGYDLSSDVEYTSYGLSDVTGYVCTIEFAKDGTPRKASLHRYLAKAPRLSAAVDSPVLSFPCTPAEMERCFGKPFQVTEHPSPDR